MTMDVGDSVTIFGTDSIWDGKSGVVESIDDVTNRCTIMVDFVPNENKFVRQDFDIDNVKTNREEA